MNTNILDNINLTQESKYFKELKKELNDIMYQMTIFLFQMKKLKLIFQKEEKNPSTGITEVYKKDLLKG